MTGVVHIAGNDVQVGSRLRQRCAWCGAVLVDYDLANIAVPVGQAIEGTSELLPLLVAADNHRAQQLPHSDEHATNASARSELAAP